MVHQVFFGQFAGLIVHPGRQVGKEVPDDLDMLGTQITALLGARGPRQHGFQHLAGDRGARTQVAGLGDAAGGFAFGDPQPGAQHIGQ